MNYQTSFSYSKRYRVVQMTYIDYLRACKLQVWGQEMYCLTLLLQHNYYKEWNNDFQFHLRRNLCQTIQLSLKRFSKCQKCALFLNRQSYRVHRHPKWQSLFDSRVQQLIRQRVLLEFFHLKNPRSTPILQQGFQHIIVQ